MAVAAPAERNERGYWLEQMRKVTWPVVDALSKRKLKATMPVEAAKGREEERRKCTHLEVLGRTLTGIAPWLVVQPGSAAEAKMQQEFIAAVQQGMAAALDPASPDHLDFTASNQCLVDAAFLALAMVRAPKVLIEGLDATTKKRLADALRSTRSIKPGMNNWLLFAAGVEVGLHAMGEEWDRERVGFALEHHAKWYIGDGTYGDGPHYHADYYDSFVIHPFLVTVLETFGDEKPEWKTLREAEAGRAVRYAHIQERVIGGDGTYPANGRSIAYRCGAFHHLADTALRRRLPEDVSPEQVRCALAAVIRRTLEAPGTFDRNGWLQIGLCGHQPSLGEIYISTGSLYLCSAAFLPLGLPASDRFWSAPDAKWTAQKLWSGVDMPADHAMDE